MNPLQAKLVQANPSSSPLLSLTKASPLAAQSKAQKMRVHAQEARGEATRDEFQERLKRYASEKSERAERSEGKEDSRAQGADEPDRPIVQGDGHAGDHGGKTRAEGGASPAQAAPASGAEPPDVERVVEELLQGVDPVLRLRPVEAAKKMGTVAGHTAEAKHQVAIEQTQSGGRAARGDADAAQPGKASTNSRPGPEERQAAESNPPAQPTDVHESTPERPEAATINRELKSEKGQPSAAAAAVERAAPIVLPAGLMKAPDDHRLAIENAPGIAGSAAARSENGTKPEVTGRPAATIAQQVRQGLEVAMREVPAPAGERIVTLRLHPSALGSLRIAMQVRGDAVSLRFQVGSAKAKAAIGHAVEDLKGAIARQGLRIESLEIEEESALAAPASAESGSGVQGAAGKGFAIGDLAPPGPEAPGSNVDAGRTPGTVDADDEGGVLQVLTFRLDAVG